ncbi:MAG: ABC transporter ATP-binding protein [Clostridiales bacterium]|jgi:oligopeptide transport system ATP-binding protein|nr:ABC transporter ATP-binding protein [Clostridiales bacterium]
MGEGSGQSGQGQKIGSERELERELGREQGQARAQKRAALAQGLEQELARPILEIEDMSVAFHTPSGVVHAVSGVSWSLRRGEILGIVGESGSGKSVSANALMRILPKSARVTGKIRVLGRDISTQREKEFNLIRGKDIAMIFQDPMTSLNPLYTVGNQLTETISQHTGLRGKAARRRAAELLALVSIPQPELRLKQFPHEFSGGMRQRVMIAMALACDPSILIADEPTTALDVTIQAQILQILRDIKERISTSIVLITHDLGIVADLCDRVNIMYGSQIMEAGATDDIFYRTAHPYTRGLLNCLPEAAAMRGKKRLVPIAGAPVDLMMLPEGCVFAARCAYCMNVCLKRRPVPADVEGERHTSRCWRAMLKYPWQDAGEPAGAGAEAGQGAEQGAGQYAGQAAGAGQDAGQSSGRDAGQDAGQGSAAPAGEGVLP